MLSPKEIMRTSSQKKEDLNKDMGNLKRNQIEFCSTENQGHISGRS